MRREDWLLVYLYLLEERAEIIDPIRIMKGLFLMRMKLENELKEFYNFEPYLYGPCSFEVYDDLLQLRKERLVDEYKPSGARWNYYRITQAGIDKVKELIKTVSGQLVEKIKGIKEEVINLSFFNLLRKIYKEYPEYTKNSVINFRR